MRQNAKFSYPGEGGGGTSKQKVCSAYTEQVSIDCYRMEYSVDALSNKVTITRPSSY